MKDVVIIGGGIAGVSAAASLSSVANVTLLEAEPHLGHHTSGRSAALFEEHYGNAAVRALNRASHSDLAAASVLSPRGLLVVGLAEDEAAFEQDCEDMALTKITPAEARSRVQILSPEIVFAAHGDDAQDIDTDRLLQGYARTAKTNGANIVTKAAVSAISRDERWSITTENAEFRADIVVNAAGAWADGVAGMAGISPIGLQPFRRSVARLPAPDGHDVRGWPLLFGAGESWYAKADAGGWIVSAAEEDPSEPMDAWADDMVIAEGIARYQDRVTSQVTRVETTWAGLRTFAPDRVLVIGESPERDGFFWLAGQGGYGFQSAPAAARLLTDLIIGQVPSLDAESVAALSPARFRPS